MSAANTSNTHDNETTGILSALSRRQFAALSVGALGAMALGGAALAEEGASDASDGEVSSASAASDSAAGDGETSNASVVDGWVIDMAGDQAIEAGTAKTILTVNSVATEMVLMLGGEDAAATVGDGFQYADGSLNQSMYPNLADRASFTRDDCTVENVAAVGPDLVLIDVPDTIATLRGSDINAAYASVISPDTIMQAIDMIGGALGGDALEKAASYRAAYEAAIEDVSGVAADLADEDKPTVLYLRSINSTCGADSMPDNWITTCGGVNVAAELGLSGSRVEIGTEAIMSADPDVIVCESPSTYEEVTASAALSELQAIQNGTVYTAPLGPVVWSMGSTEALLQLYWAANVINPDLYGYDVEAITRDYFETFYGYELSDEELEEILNQ